MWRSFCALAFLLTVLLSSALATATRPSDGPDDYTLSLKEACRRLNISLRTGYRLVKADQFPVKPHRVGHQWRIDGRRLDEYQGRRR